MFEVKADAPLLDYAEPLQLTRPQEMTRLLAIVQLKYVPAGVIQLLRSQD